MLTFDKSKHMELLYGANEVVTDTLVEFILEDIMDISPEACDPEDPDIVYEEFRSLPANLNALLPIFFFFAGIIFPKATILERTTHPKYVSKVTYELGYYTYLYRLRPF